MRSGPWELMLKAANGDWKSSITQRVGELPLLSRENMGVGTPVKLSTKGILTLEARS